MRVKLRTFIRTMGKKKKITKAEAKKEYKEEQKKRMLRKPNQTVPPSPFIAWDPPTTTEANLLNLWESGFLPDKDLCEWKVPEEQLFPSPNTGEIVCFQSFFERGFGLPAFDFFRGLLHFYQITLNHLNPNSIAQISIFVHTCEAFLGIPPSITLFRYFFRLKPHPKDVAPAVVGGAGVQLRRGRKDEFFDYNLPDPSKTKWKKGWFYMGNLRPPLTTHTGFSPVNNRWWSEVPTTKEMEKIHVFLDQLKSLKDYGLTAEVVVASWLRRRIQPLQYRLNYGFEYDGVNDPARHMLKSELSDCQILARLKKIMLGVKVMPKFLKELRATNPPKGLSGQELGRKFMDLPPLPPSDEAVDLRSGQGPVTSEGPVEEPDWSQLKDDSSAIDSDEGVEENEGTEGTSKRSRSLGPEDDLSESAPRKAQRWVGKISATEAESSIGEPIQQEKELEDATQGNPSMQEEDEQPWIETTNVERIDTAQDGQEGSLVGKEVPPATSSQVGDAGRREEPENRVGSKAVLANEPGTQHQTYSTDLTQAKSLWSELFSKSSEFDAIMKNLELKASEQARKIHADLSAEVVKLKAAHAEQESQWKIIENSQKEAIRLLCAEVDELERQNKQLQERAETAKKSASALEKKAKDEAAKVERLQAEAINWQNKFSQKEAELQEALRMAQQRGSPGPSYNRA